MIGKQISTQILLQSFVNARRIRKVTTKTERCFKNVTALFLYYLLIVSSFLECLPYINIIFYRLASSTFIISHCKRYCKYTGLSVNIIGAMSSCCS